MTAPRTVATELKGVRSCRLRGGTMSKRGHTYLVQFERIGGKVRAKAKFDFAGHPLRALISRYLFADAEDSAAGSIVHHGNTLKYLGEFLTGGREHDLNPRTFQAFLRWMINTTDKNGAARFGEESIINSANITVKLYRCGLDNSHPGFSQRDLDAILVTRKNLLRGLRQRAAQVSIDKALSEETYYDLLRAVSLELEQCRLVLAQRNAGERFTLYNYGAQSAMHLDPNPYVVLAAYCGLLNGVRAPEFNSLGRADLRVDRESGRHELYLNAPNKADGFIPVSDVFVEVWSLCEEWDKEARDSAGDSGSSGGEAGFVYFYGGNQFRGAIPVHTIVLNRSFLPSFYEKWFRHEVEGRPLLHAENDVSSPLKCPYSKFRNAFAVHFAGRERNRHTTKEVLRHKDVSTSERFYLNTTKLDHAKKVYYALKPEAQILAMGLKNPVAAGIAAETLERAKSAGALLPHGVCGVAMSGDDCVRASGCLECPHLVVIASRKPRFEADRDQYLKKADVLHAKGDIRGAENALSQAKLCQAHIARIDYTFGGVANG